MPQTIAGTFAATTAPAVGLTSDILVVPTGVTTMRLNLSGAVDANNRVHVQKSTDNGQSWTLTNNLAAVQSGLAITVAAGEHWRCLQATGQVQKNIQYSFTVES